MHELEITKWRSFDSDLDLVILHKVGPEQVRLERKSKDMAPTIGYGRQLLKSGGSDGLVIYKKLTRWP